MKTDDTDTIILDRSRNSRAFEDRESLWAPELSRIMDRLWDHTESLDVVGPRATDEGPRQSGDHRPYLSIAIFGPSGSGKSSLLRTLVRVVNGSEAKAVTRLLRDRGASQGKDKDLHRLRGLLYALPVMQPDRFAEHDHFLYAFLANALKAEKEQRERRESRRDERRRDDDRRYEPDALSPVQQRFQELSDFLRVIDEPEKSRDYDPLGLSLERLERHTSALLLREKIGRFIDSLADELAGKPAKGGASSVVLLTVDDVDMSPEHLVTALKVYQTYLLHPRLVPVFTFTDRTAEEILRGYFHRHLSTFSLPDRKGSARQPMTFATAGEGSQRLSVGDQLALQYLARCFPVRNRIRLGPAPARFRDMQYKVSEGGAKEGESAQEKPVATLLLAASQLLFGTADRDAKNRIRAALRPSTLRRQFHVVDEMTAVGVEDYFERPTEDGQTFGPWRLGFSVRSKKEIEKRRKDNDGDLGWTPLWFEVFDRAAWALMNVHRDVLREYDLHLEDIYSWTPQGLRRLLLDTLLAQPIEVRRALIRRWRFRLSSRRGETISLLAANVFRPWMPGEEPTGDATAMKVYDKDELKGVTEGRNHLSAPTALIWFLDLAIGFYQPQILAWNRPTTVASSNPQTGRVVGVGWNLETGAVNAIRTARENEAVAAAGMLFLDPRKFSSALNWPLADKGEGGNSSAAFSHNAILLLRCWTYYGYSSGRYWAAVSLWRGLGLLGKLLRMLRERELDRLPLSDGGGDLKEKVAGILRNHLIRGLVPGQLVGEGETGSRLDIAFKRWDLTPVGQKGVKLDLVERIVDWLQKYQDSVKGEAAEMIQLMAEGEDDLKNGETRWDRSLLRRLHGDDIVGSLLTRLNATYIDDQENDDLFRTGIDLTEQGPESSDGKSDPKKRWNAGIAMTTWTRVFLDYWRGLQPMQELLRTCPIVAPFAEGPVTDSFRDHTVNAFIGQKSKKEDLPSRLGRFAGGWQNSADKLEQNWETAWAATGGQGKEASKPKNGSWARPEKDERDHQTQRFTKRVGLKPDQAETAAEVEKTEVEQIDAFVRNLSGVCLFYAIPWELPDDSRARRPSSAPNCEGVEESSQGDNQAEAQPPDGGGEAAS